MDEENFTHRHAKTVAAFTEMSYDECMKAIPWQDLLKVSGMIAEFLGQLQEPRLVHFVTLDGVEYGFHPQVANMTAGEYIDLTNLDRGFWLDADKAMAILYRPVKVKIGNKYQVEEYGAPFHPMLRDELHVRVFEQQWADSEADLGLVYINGADQVSHLYWPYADEGAAKLMELQPEEQVTLLWL